MKNKFDTIYQELYEKNNNILNNSKKEKNKKIVIVFFILFIINVCVNMFSQDGMMILITFCISLILMLFVLILENHKYRKIFKEKIMQELVKKINSKLQFDPKGIMLRSEYIASKFDVFFDELHSEDMIYGNIQKNVGFKMSQIVTKKIQKERDVNGKVQTTKIETFRGIYGKVILPKSANSKIYIANNSFTKKYSQNRVEMDSAEFERSYDCLTKDKITAMKIFTSDLLEKFVSLKKGRLSGFHLKIEDNQIYFRCPCGEVFEPPKIKDALDKQTILKYYNTISIPLEIIEKIVENINML